MKLIWVEIENFRCYSSPVRFSVSDITAFIGKNDSGKSSIFDALGIFFGNTKFNTQDRFVHGVNNASITCAFADYPSSTILDEDALTTFESEYLLSEDRLLVVKKEYDNLAKERSFVVAYHPSNPDANDLHSLTNAQLKTRCRQLSVPENEYDSHINNTMRKAIWRSLGDAIQLETLAIPLEKNAGKTIGERIKGSFPSFHIFKADRQNLDDEAEAKGPIGLSISAAIQRRQEQFNRLAADITAEVQASMTRTIEAMASIDPEIARSLVPDYRKPPDWTKVFDYSLLDDNNIPINKRGSGIRRLVLFSFFRATVEESEINDVIYAIEEPETSQHPNYQKLFVSTLKDMSEKEHVQVMLTTHVPGLAEELPQESIRYVSTNEDGIRTITSAAVGEPEAFFEKISKTLGVFSNYSSSSVKAIFCVEGPNDIDFWLNISSILHSSDDSIISLADEPRIAMIPLGGGTLKAWVDNRYLQGLRLPSYYVFDRDEDAHYAHQCEVINARGNEDRARLTNKREIENYVHRDAIISGYHEHRIDIELPELTATDDIPLIVAQAVYLATGGRWDTLTDEKKHEKESRAKKRICSEFSKLMTIEQLEDIDPEREIIGILEDLKRYIED